jgi:predicted GIY-YIG superfamily endonuclease
MFYVYLICNEKNGKTYIGYTADLKRRVREHKDKNPELIYYEAYRAEKDARDREQKLKQRGQTVRRLKARLRESFKN